MRLKRLSGAVNAVRKANNADCAKDRFDLTRGWTLGNGIAEEIRSAIAFCILPNYSRAFKNKHNTAAQMTR